MTVSNSIAPIPRATGDVRWLTVMDAGEAIAGAIKGCHEAG